MSLVPLEAKLPLYLVSSLGVARGQHISPRGFVRDRLTHAHVLVSLRLVAACSLSPAVFVNAVRFRRANRRQGKVRLSKWYSDGSGEGAYNSAKQRAAVVREVTGEIMMRKGKHCNFMELSRRNDVLVTYKRFAGLYFIIGISKGTDNELIALETIQVCAFSD